MKFKSETLNHQWEQNGKYVYFAHYSYNLGHWLLLLSKCIKSLPLNREQMWKLSLKWKLYKENDKDNKKVIVKPILKFIRICYYGTFSLAMLKTQSWVTNKSTQMNKYLWDQNYSALNSYLQNNYTVKTILETKFHTETYLIAWELIPQYL